MAIVVRVELKSVYGNIMAYPANPAAEHLAAIAKTRTLGPRELARAEAMGCAVEVMGNQGDVQFLSALLSAKAAL
jgi:hypothetical protein